MNPSPFRKTTLALALTQAFFTVPLFYAPNVAAQDADKGLPEVVVNAPRIKADHGETASVGGFGTTPLLQTPASVSVITSEQMQDLQMRSTTDAVRQDASVSESYNAVGYAEQFSIRGYNLDNLNSYRKDGLVISGDASIPLENKERIEILKGLAGLQAGVTAPGGIINYVTKRPTAEPLRTVTVGLSERGTAYAAADLGGKFADPRFGYRINVADERLRSYVRGADGNRQLVAGAFDWQVSPAALLQLDLDYAHKAQVSQPGFQLINGADLPVNIDPATMLNNQPWSKPVDTRTSNVGLRFEYKLGGDWRLTLAGNQHRFKRDDYAAFPYGGCSSDLFAGFCANGDYDVYDYQSTGESKPRNTTRSLLQGSVQTGAVSHALSFGLDTLSRHDYAGVCVYGMADCDGSVADGTSNIYYPVVVPPSPKRTGDIMLMHSENQRSVFLQDILGLTADLKLHLGLRYIDILRDKKRQNMTLPNAAVVYNVQPNVVMYASYAQGVEPGGIAPVVANNPQDEQLSPAKSRQSEVGIKADITPDWRVSAALFDTRKPLEIINAANFFVRAGDDQHRGLELASDGSLTKGLNLHASVAALDAKQRNTGDTALEGKRPADVPKFKSEVQLDYALPALPALRLNGQWTHSGDKAFDAGNTVLVSGYDVFNLGVRYELKVGTVATTLRFAVNNVADKFYWRDVTPQLGGYLFPGAPRTYRASAQFDF